MHIGNPEVRAQGYGVLGIYITLGITLSLIAFLDQGIEMLLDVWEEWKSGEMTEPEMIDEAKQDLLSYLSSVLH